MTNFAKNNYIENPKESSIETPAGVAKFIYDKTKHLLTSNSVVVDVCAGNGNLARYFYDLCIVKSIEKNQDCHLSQYSHQRDGNEMIFTDFLEDELPSDYKKCDLVITNPPWNNPERLYKKALLPELFLKKIFEIYGFSIPVALIVPFGFRMNQECKSKRFRWLRDCGARITSTCTLPRDIFKGVNLQCEVIFFNIPGLEAHYYLDERYIAMCDDDPEMFEEYV